MVDVIHLTLNLEKLIDKDREEQIKKESGPFWYVFHCVESTETRGKDPNKQRTTPCENHSVWKRRKRLKWPEKRTDRATQARCSICGNRPRLTPGMVEECNSELEARQLAAKLNEGQKRNW